MLRGLSQHLFEAIIKFAEQHGIGHAICWWAAGKLQSLLQEKLWRVL
jgi:hypothetical protein